MGWVGRQAEAEQLNALLSRGAVLVTGPPGIGKSALVARLPTVAWVDLQGCTHEEDWSARLCVALDAVAASREGLLAAARRQTVLVLDSVDGLGDWFGDWLVALSGCAAVVMTSRRRLDVDAAQIELGPLTAQEGAALLRERVQSVRRAEALDEDELRRLSEALDGVPLALELVAPRLRLRAVSDLVLRPTEGLDPLLDSVRAGRETCSAAAQRLLDVAAVLPGPFDAQVLGIAAAEAVDDSLLELLDRSLIHPLPGRVPQFRLLAPVRAALIPSQALQQAVDDRLAAHLLPMVEAAVDGLDALDAVDAVRLLGRHMAVLARLVAHQNAEVRLRAALVMAAKERRTGPLSALLERDERLVDEGPASMRVMWSSQVAVAASHFGQHARAQQALERVSAVLTDEDLPRWRSQRAVVWVSAGKVEEGLREAAAVEALASEDPMVWLRIGMARFYAGALEAAIGPLRRGRDRATRSFRRAQAAVTLGAALRDMGAPADAVAAELALGGPVPDWLASRADFLKGVVAADQGDLVSARSLLAAGAAAMRNQGEPAHAFVVDRLAQALCLIDGAPRLQVEGDDSDIGRAWEALHLAANGEAHGAVALARPGLDAMCARQDRNGPELAAMLAVAIGPAHPELVEQVLAPHSADHRLVRLARQLLGGSEASVMARVEDRIMAALSRRHPSLVRVARDGSGFVSDDGEAVSIAGRRVLRRVLACLAETDGALGVEALCAQVWPGERLVGESGTRRVHVAVSTLRSLGLRGAIHTLTQADGSTAWALIAERT
jgi:hypothetical protein